MHYSCKYLRRSCKKGLNIGSNLDESEWEISHFKYYYSIKKAHKHILTVLWFTYCIQYTRKYSKGKKSSVSRNCFLYFLTALTYVPSRCTSEYFLHHDHRKLERSSTGCPGSSSWQNDATAPKAVDQKYIICFSRTFFILKSARLHEIFHYMMGSWVRPTVC